MLTEQQQKKMELAVGDGNDWPKFTDDAMVNYAIDQSLQEEGDYLPTWDKLPVEDKQLYLDEIAAHIERFGAFPEGGVCAL